MIIKDVKVEDDIYADSAEKFSAPRLEKVEDIYANSAKEFSVPKLEEGRGIWALVQQKPSQLLI